MNDGKHCPACEKDIGLWPVFSALWPTFIRCPHCRTRLRYHDSLIQIVIMVILAVAFGIVAYSVTKQLELANTNQQLLTFIAILLAAWVPTELIMSIYLRNNKVLRKSGDTDAS